MLGASRAEALRLAFRSVSPAGSELAGAEVCVQPGGRSIRYPFEAFFTTNDVRCYPADAVVAFPPGRWNFFGRHADGFVTSHPYQIAIPDDRDLTDTGLKTVQLQFVEAASVNVSALAAATAPKEFVTLYFPSSESALPQALPIPRGTATMLVPAAAPFIPLLIASGQPIRAGNLHVAKRGQTLSIADFNDPVASADAIGVLNIPPPKAGGDRLQDRGSPAISLITATSEEYRATLPLEHVSDGEIVLFKRLPQNVSIVRLRLSGSTWRPMDLAVSFQPAPGIHTLPPLNSPRTGALRVTFSDAAFRSWSEALQSARAGCPDLPQRPASLDVELCRVDEHGAECAPVQRIKVALSSLQDRTIEALDAGSYRLTVRHNGAVVFTGDATVHEGDLSPVDVRPVLVAISGHIRRGEKPVVAQIAFRGGSGISDATTGYYSTVLTQAPGAAIVVVTTCDGTRRYALFPKAPIAAGDTYDVALPENEVWVRVVDKSSGQPVAGARTSVNLLSDDGSPLREYGPPTGSEGEAQLTSIALGRPFAVCATAPGFEEGCSEPLEPKTSGPTKAVVRLGRTAMSTGRLVTPFDITGGGALYLVGGGTVTGVISIAADGTFEVNGKAAACNYSVLASRSHPLAIGGCPRTLDNGSVEVQIEAGPVHSIRVELASSSPDPDSMPGLVIGARPIPAAAFQMHQAWRGEQAIVERGKSIRVRDVVGSAPLWVLRGYASRRPPDLPAGDQFLVAALPREPVSSDVVVFR